MSRRISSGVFGRPLRGLDFQRQYARKPARCHRITVSGLTILKAASTPGASLSLKGEGGIKGRVFASGLRCSRGSYRQHATKGVDVNKGDPSGSNESL